MGWARGLGASLIGAESVLENPGRRSSAGQGPSGVWWVWAKEHSTQLKSWEGSRGQSAEEQVKFVDEKWNGARRKNYRARQRKSFSGMEVGPATFRLLFSMKVLKVLGWNIVRKIIVVYVNRWLFQTSKINRFILLPIAAIGDLWSVIKWLTITLVYSWSFLSASSEETEFLQW